MKDVYFDLEKFTKGMKVAARAVGGTIGPLGKNVFLADPVLPRFTNDGASIANKIVLADPQEDAGAWVIRSATARASDESGDGTTTTAVIAESIFDESTKKKESAVEVRRSLYKALPKVIDAIAKSSRKTTKDDILSVALVSSEDETLSNLIVEAFDKKGEDAHILIEDSSTAVSSIEIKEGYEAKVGFMSPWLVTNASRQTAEYQQVPVLCSHKKIDTITQLLPLYEKLSQKQITKLVIVCEDMDIAALGTIVDNKRRGTFSTLVIKATGDLLDDIACVVNAVPISDATGSSSFDDDILKKLGTADSIVSTFGNPPLSGITTFVGTKGKSSQAKAQASMLEAQAENSKNDIEKGSLRKRAARLRSGIAVLKIGSFSEQEQGYLRDKADDAVKAVKAALAEGYVEGGGMCLYRIAEKMKPESVGEEILKVALTAPLKKIVENSGKDYAEVVKGLSEGKGYDAKEAKYADLVKSKIIDPAKVVRIAVESAVSSMGEMLVTHALVVEHHEEKK